MMIEEEYIRLIFGLKLKQVRTEKNLSLFGLSKLTGLSKSYLNEIEKGKKYPKTDKILLLSEALDIPYDQLVSIKLDKNLAPLGEILQSKILKEIPLNLFGIQENDLIDIIAEAPAKVNAFISTIIKIAQNYNLSRESFFLASLRSYQEAHNNYFKDIEELAVKFAEAYQINLEKTLSSSELEEILKEEYGYTINETELDKYKELDNLRCVFIPKNKILLLDGLVDEAQRTFIYAKEIAYNYLNIKERLYTFPWIQFKSFDEVLNNFYASYFAGALVIPRKTLTRELKSFFNHAEFDNSAFLKMIEGFNASPESFYQRLTNILPVDFNLKNLFFLRFTHKSKSNRFHLKKELHITHQQSPQANELNEHYCRRWVSIKTLQEIEKTNQQHVFDVQISDYVTNGNKYLVLSSATQDPFKKGYYRSISIGFLISANLKQKVNFIDNEHIETKRVGVTCETCPITDCKERMVPPVQIEKQLRYQKTAELVERLILKYSS